MKNTILAAAVLLLLAACSSKKKAADFNNKIVTLEKELAPVYQDADRQMLRFKIGGKLDSIAWLSEKMEKVFDEKIRQLEDTKAPGGEEAETLKKDALNYFMQAKSMFTASKKYGAATTREQILQIDEECKEALNKIRAASSALKATQKKFAEANGMKIK